jgi:phosphoribosylformylglycinamidine synthase subunit PurSL
LLLFSESNTRFVVEVLPKDRAAFERLFTGIRAACVGRVTREGRLKVRGLSGGQVMDESIGELKEAWQAPLKNP